LCSRRDAALNFSVGKFALLHPEVRSPWYFKKTSSSAIAERPRWMDGQFWPKLENNIL